MEIEDNEEVMNAINDHELQKIDESAKNKNKITVDDYNDDEEDEIIMTEEKPRKVKSKVTHNEITKAFDMIQSFMEDENLPLENRLSLDRLQYSVQMHQIWKPKDSPTITKFFQPNKRKV